MKPFRPTLSSERADVMRNLEQTALPHITKLLRDSVWDALVYGQQHETILCGVCARPFHKEVGDAIREDGWENASGDPVDYFHATCRDQLRKRAKSAVEVKKEEWSESNSAKMCYDLRCRDCGWPIVDACCNGTFRDFKDAGSSDYWWYCANKGCRNHEGEEYWQVLPRWVRPSYSRSSQP